MTLQLALIVLAALVAGAVVGLKVIAPLTKTTVDDEVLKRLETLEQILKGLQPKA
jgi:hypothetical protein